MKLFDIQKYLRKNPVQEEKIFRSCSGFFTFAAVIPMLNESKNAEVFFRHLNCAIENSHEKILVICVVNCAENSPDEYKNDNLKLLELFDKNKFNIPNLAVIDCTTEGKMLKNGVGEARKTGMDYALDFFDTADFETSIICSLDADTVIEKNYFSLIRENFRENPDCGVLTFNVCHQSDAENPRAIAQYEKYLKSYREGLEFAGSPYAFYTVGSAFAVRASSYIRAGGMRKLPAGEDFYFLQSAVKSSAVKHCSLITVYPSARYSARVPFGTGTALRAIDSDAKEFTPFPDFAFAALKKVIDNATTDNLSSADKFLSALPAESANFFIQHNFAENWQKVISNMPTNQLRDAFLCHWFDGLKTLQFIKHISSSGEIHT